MSQIKKDFLEDLFEEPPKDIALEKLCEKLKFFIGYKIKEIEIKESSKYDFNSHLNTTISKLSPLISNIIEFDLCHYLNLWNIFDGGYWERNESSFPDLRFISRQPKNIVQGIEVKAWEVNSTEITCRFRESLLNFKQNNIYVLLFGWRLEEIYKGTPVLLDFWYGQGEKVAYNRDKEYFNPPHNLIIEPYDNNDKNKSLKQTNSIGLIFQGNKEERTEAEKEVDTWLKRHNEKDIIYYKSSLKGQVFLNRLRSKYKYRVDTNFGKMDRFKYDGIDEFKLRIFQKDTGF